MDLLDINVLIYAHREDAPEHARYAKWLRDMVERQRPFALTLSVLAGFLRLVTNGKIFKPPTPMAAAIEFCDQLRTRPNCTTLIPTEAHWGHFTELIRATGARGAFVSDVQIAAFAIEHGCDLVSADRDFARFPGLKWRHPMASG